MGLGLSLPFIARPRGLLRRRPVASDVVRDLARDLASRAGRAFPLLARCSRVHEMDDGSMRVGLHPAAEDVLLEPEGAHGVRVTARTNVPGPGYHAFLLEQLELCGRELALDLQDGDEQDPVDETGYHATRDFAALQSEMAAWLRGVATAVDPEPGTSGHMISMSIGTPTLLGPGVLTPTGVVTAEWLRALRELSGERLERECPAFFPWWESGTGAEARIGLARTLLFDLPWHPPIDEREQAHTELARDILREIDPRTRFGADTASVLLAELDALLSTPPEDAHAPRSDGFGFRRQVLEHQVFDGVRLQFPGWAYAESEDDGATAHAWWGTSSVRVSTVDFDPEALEQVRELQAEEVAQAAAAGPRRTFRFADGAGDGWIERERDEDGVSIGRAFLTVPGTFARVTFAFRELDDAEVERILCTLSANSRSA